MIGIQHALLWMCLNSSKPWCPTIPAVWTIYGPPYYGLNCGYWMNSVQGGISDTRFSRRGCMDRGVELKWFGNKEPVCFTSAYSSWKYLGKLPSLPNTDRILSTMCDMRVPLTSRSGTPIEIVSKVILAMQTSQQLNGISERSMIQKPSDG